MGKNKKPTMMEVKSVISSVIERMELLENHINNLDHILAAFIDYKKDSKKFQNYITKRAEELSNKKEDK
tara:strand:- start:2 stop:208 length:207 start_codon:yes stop_codon:yes gene_type:complete